MGDTEGLSAGSRVRSTNDGQLGFVVELDDGRLGVRLDRKGEQRVVPYRAPEWIVAREPQLTPIQVARVFHDADRALRISRGAYSTALPEWQTQREETRREWLDKKRWQPVMDFLLREL